MANSTDIVVSSGETITIVPQNIEYLAKNGEQYTIVFANGTSKIVSNQAFESVKALDYSGGGSVPTGIVTSDTITNMEYADNTLTIDGNEFKGGSSMVYDTTSGELSGAKDQDGNDVTLNVNTITISF